MAILLTVIIPTCNRNDMLAQCLALLAPGKQTLPATAYEVIVSDDGAGIGAEEICINHYPWVHYTRGPRRGPAANRNHGAQFARGSWLVFTDDDCMPGAHLLELYTVAIKKFPDVRAFEGAIVPDNNLLLKKELAECPVNTTGDCFWSANIAIEGQLFAHLKGFDETFALAAQEDQDLKRRVKACTEIYFIREAEVIHPVRMNTFTKKMAQIAGNWSNWMKYVNKLSVHERRARIRKSIKNHAYSVCVNLKKWRIRTVIIECYSLSQYLRLLFYRFD